ncbi:MAG: hypothetical protein ACXVCA_12575 [Bdellovibrio sp.]
MAMNICQYCETGNSPSKDLHLNVEVLIIAYNEQHQFQGSILKVES